MQPPNPSPHPTPFHYPVPLPRSPTPFPYPVPQAQVLACCNEHTPPSLPVALGHPPSSPTYPTFPPFQSTLPPVTTCTAPLKPLPNPPRTPRPPGKPLYPYPYPHPTPSHPIGPTCTSPLKRGSLTICLADTACTDTFLLSPRFSIEPTPPPAATHTVHTSRFWS